ncbi:hypothetical protein COL154_014033, partial [Colletotrichum chrysophilum]
LIDLFSDVGLFFCRLSRLTRKIIDFNRRVLDGLKDLNSLVSQLLDNFLDIVSALLSSRRQGANLVSYNRKATPLLTCTSSLNSCIQSK